MIIRVALAILLTVPFLSSGAAPKWKRVLPHTPPGVTLHTNLVCATYGERKVTLDLYVPDAPGKHPGILFIEGEKDSVKIGRAEMQEKLRTLKIETGLFTLKDGPHPFWMSQPWLDETAAHALAFFDRHLKRK